MSAAAGIRVVEVDRSDRQDRRRQGKSDPLDGSAPPGPPSPAGPAAPQRPGRRGGGDPGADGRQAQRPRRADPDHQPGQVPDRDRARRPADPVRPAHRRRPGGRDRIAAAPPRRAPSATPPGSRCASWDDARSSSTASSSAWTSCIVPLVTARAPGLLALYGVGPDTAALLLIAAGDHPARLRSEAAWAHLCAAAPIPASSGKLTRHRLNPGGDRQANHALWRIVITRMSSHPPTRAYVERRTEKACRRRRSSAV